MLNAYAANVQSPFSVDYPCIFDMAPQDPLLDILRNLAVLSVGTVAGYFFGVRLFRIRLREDEDAKKREMIESIILELECHESSLEAHPKYEYVHPDEVRARSFAVYRDDAFKGSIKSGYFRLLSMELQRMLVEHYHYCDMINTFQREGISTMDQKEANYHISTINRYLGLLRTNGIIIALERELES